MNVMFIYTLSEIQSISKPIRDWTNIPFGISYISSVLKANGHDVRLLVLGSLNIQRSFQNLNTMMDEFNPNIVCFTAVASQYQAIKKIARFIKTRWPDKLLVVGGPHASLNPEQLIKDAFDILCIGEGEYSMTELCNHINENRPLNGIDNLWIKNNDGTVQKSPMRPFLQNLDVLPFPDREIWKPWISEETQIKAPWSILLGRGCPYNCTYCSNHALRKIALGKYVRMRSPCNIISEIAHVYRAFPECKKIFFEVEAIALDKMWALELCAQLEIFNQTINSKISYGCNFRISPQSLDETLFMAMEQANIREINIGLESGSERVRREVLKRNYSNQDFLNTVAMARKHSFSVFIYNMIGIPGETINDHMETVLLNRQCQPNVHSTGIFFPYPGTELYNMCIKQGFLKGEIDADMERQKAFIDLPGFSRKQIQSAYIWFNYRVYKGHRPFWSLLMQVVVLKMRANTSTNFLFHTISGTLHKILRKFQLTTAVSIKKNCSPVWMFLFAGGQPRK